MNDLRTEAPGQREESYFIPSESGLVPGLDCCILLLIVEHNIVVAGGGQGAGADWSRLLAPDQTKTYRPLCPALLTLQTPQKTYKDTAKR